MTPATAVRRFGRDLAAALSLLLAAAAGYANQCGTPSMNGDAASVPAIPNAYYPGVASVAAGATALQLGAATGAATPISIGDLLLVIQMQGAAINSTNSASYGDNTPGNEFANGYTAIGQTGRYEFVRAATAVAAGGGSVTIVGGGGAGLIYAYSNAGASGTAGQQRFQVIRVPQFRALTLSTAVTAARWNGTTGGVVALDVADRLTFSGGSIGVSGLGFRGGAGRDLPGGGGANTDYATLATVNTNGSKGEGVAGTPRYVDNAGTRLDTGIEGYPGGASARGAPGNAGGGGTDGQPSDNANNSGGGGGGGAGPGGKGGNAYCPAKNATCPTSGGHPGAVVAPEVTRIAMGGGGGAGSNNNASGTPAAGVASSGAAGGGIVFVRAGEIAGSGTIAANGADANNTVGNDGNGGGGAGGTVALVSLRAVAGASVSVSARGGSGGSNTGTGPAAGGTTSPHGPGGGGGGGAVLYTTTISVSSIIAGGSPGTTVTSVVGPNYGATAGVAGTSGFIAAANVPGLSSGGECTPTVTKAFAAAAGTVGTDNRLTVSVRNNNPTLAITGVAFTDTYPAGLVNAPVPSTLNGCAPGAPGTLTAAAGGPSLRLSAGVVPAAQVCAYSVTTRATSTGLKTNTIAASGVTGTYGTGSVGNATPATATFDVQAPLAVTKTSAVFTDPSNGATLPKAIPGAVVTYTITVQNTASYTVTTDTLKVTDNTPANLSLVVADLGAAGSGPVAFQDGSPTSALTYGYVSPGSTTDGLEFSAVAGNWTYSPTPGVDGTDPAVIALRIGPRGAMAAGSSFTVRVRYRIK